MKKRKKKTEAPSSDSSDSSDISESELTFNADDDTELDVSDNEETAAAKKKKRLQCPYEQVQANNILEQRKMLAEFKEEDRVRRQLEAGTKQRELVLELNDDFDLDSFFFHLI